MHIQFTLPQFVAMGDPNLNTNQSQQEVKRLDQLRKQVNAAVWTGDVEECKGLVSLKDILQKDQSSSNSDQSEQYVMLSNVIAESEIEMSEGSSQEKDKRIVINRMDINFNGQKCKMLTFKDVTIYKRLQMQQE